MFNDPKVEDKPSTTLGARESNASGDMTSAVSGYPLGAAHEKFQVIDLEAQVL